jgi:ankyrin repeat protein
MQDGTTALWTAAYNGHTAVVEALLRCPGVNVDVAWKEVRQ